MKAGLKPALDSNADVKVMHITPAGDHIWSLNHQKKENLHSAREWKRNDWRNQYGEPRENADLWNQLISAHTKAGITVHFEWTLGKL